jgi:hypothetical protein
LKSRAILAEPDLWNLERLGLASFRQNSHFSWLIGRAKESARASTREKEFRPLRLEKSHPPLSNTHLYFLFGGGRLVLEFELRASRMLGRHATT